MVHRIARGETIVRARPFVYALCSEHRFERCEVCFASFASSGRLPCVGCGYVAYCSASCRDESVSSGWHSLECHVIARRPLRLMTRLIARVLLTQRAFIASEEGNHFDGADEARPAARPNQCEEFIYGQRRDWHCLMDHYDDIVHDVEAMFTFQRIYEELELIFERYPLRPPFDNVGELLKIYGKILVNSFAVMQQTGSGVLINQIGRAIYLGPSIFDHSCSPDAMFTFVGTELIVYALRDIEFDDIRDIYISYIDELEPFEGRQKQLRAGYYFDCACQRCCRDSQSFPQSLEPMVENGKLRLVLSQIEDHVNDSTDTITRLISLAEDYCARRRLGGRHGPTLKQLAETHHHHQWRSEREETTARAIADRIDKLSLASGDLTSVDVIRIVDFLAQHHVDVERMFQLVAFYEQYYDSPLHPRYRSKVLLFLGQLLLKMLSGAVDGEHCRMSIETMYTLARRSHPLTFGS